MATVDRIRWNGCVLPCSVCHAIIMSEIEEQILVPTVHGMRRRRTLFMEFFTPASCSRPKVPKFSNSMFVSVTECRLFAFALNRALELIDAPLIGLSMKYPHRHGNPERALRSHGFGGLSRNGRERHNQRPWASW